METAGALMRKNPQTVYEGDTVDSCLQGLTAMGSYLFPVVDGNGRVTGLISETALRENSRRGHGDRRLGDVCQPSGSCQEHDDAIRTLAKQLADRREATVVVDFDGRAVGLLGEDEALSLAKVCLQPWLTVADVARMGAVPAVRARDTCERAREVLEQAKHGHAVVLGVGGVLRGVVAAVDLAGRDDVSVEEVIGRLVRTAEPNDNVMEALRKLGAVGTRALPVVDEGTVVGLLTKRDVLRALTRQLIASSTTPPATRVVGPPKRS